MPVILQEIDVATPTPVIGKEIPRDKNCPKYN